MTQAATEREPEPAPPPPTLGVAGGHRVGPGGSAAIPTEKSKDFRGSSRRLATRLHSERGKMALVVMLALASVVMIVIGPKILGHATDLVFDGLTGRRGRSGVDFAALHRVLLAALGLYVVAYVLAYLQSFTLAGIVQRTMFTLRNDVEEQLNRLPLAYVDTQMRGDLLSRVTNDIDNLAQSLQQTLSQLLTSALTISGVLVMMFVISPLLAIVAVVTVPLSIWAMKQIVKRSRPKFMAQWRHTGALNALVDESFNGHAIVKAFGRQHDVEERFRTINEDLYRAGFGAQFMSGIIQPMMACVGNINYVAIAVIGGLRVSSGSMGLGDVQAFIQYSRQFSQPLNQFASMINVLQSGVASAERIFEVLDAPAQSGDPSGSLLAEVPRGLVEFDDVSFSYRPDQPLIEHLDLVAEPGSTIAIVGPTGAGKTTLVNLIMRFYEVGSGAIRLDGHDITAMSRRELRSNIGMVLQDTWLFGGTIRENIRYGNLDASDAQVIEAARATYVDRFVHTLPLGYDTVIDDEGSNVSAGEKQLITIARAFLADPAILILDEATSSVDTRTEVLIQHAMAALRAKRTSFVIAHRLSTIRDAEVIVVMDDGRIVERGTHEELLVADGTYAHLYQSQFAGPASAESEHGDG